MNSNQHLVNPNLADALFCLYFLIVIGIAGLDSSTGEILTPFCLFISGGLFMTAVHFFKLYLKDKKDDR